MRRSEDQEFVGNFLMTLHCGFCRLSSTGAKVRPTLARESAIQGARPCEQRLRLRQFGARISTESVARAARQQTSSTTFEDANDSALKAAQVPPIYSPRSREGVIGFSSPLPSLRRNFGGHSMAHPTCALARSPDAPSTHRTGPPTQAAAALDNLQEAYHAASCLRCLLVQVENVRESHRCFTRTELAALHAVVDSEVERRWQIVHTAAHSTPAPS